MTGKTLLVASLGLLFAACATSRLDALVLEGQELHSSLGTRNLELVSRLHVLRELLPGNPHLASDRAFVNAISRSGSQGGLTGDGVRTALYGLYKAEKELGIYGLEAASKVDADRIEEFVRGCWAHNASLERARVHRDGRVVVVVWHDGVSATCWEAANARIVARLAGR